MILKKSLENMEFHKDRNFDLKGIFLWKEAIESTIPLY